MEKKIPDTLLFSNLDLRRLIVPLIIEQILAVTVGMADVVMVSTVGEAAVSGVSLVDMLNQLIISVFAALATGGAVVVSQLLGAKERNRACDAARQLLLVVGCIAAVIMLGSLAFSKPLLRLLFGTVEDGVMQSSLTYFHLSALSYPFLALYNAGAALFRAQGNSRVSMKISIGSNLLNIAGNAIFIYGAHLGVAGAALSSLIARMLSSIVILCLLRNPELRVTLSEGGRFHIDKSLIGRILGIGVPNGIENSMFQLGRVLVVGIISAFGTTQIAANAVANNFDSMGSLPGQAMSLAIITVIGQCIGAQDYEQVRYYVKKLICFTYLITILFNAVILISLPWTMKMYDNLSAETIALATILIFIHNGFAMLFWPASFALPNVLRAANDVRFTMCTSIFSMWCFRCAAGFILGKLLGLGAIGIWIAMIIDWCFRALTFTCRYLSGKWTKLAWHSKD